MSVCNYVDVVCGMKKQWKVLVQAAVYKQCRTF